MTHKKEIEILLVEDNSSDAELTIRVLKKNNLVDHLIHLRDGAQALDFLFARGPYAGTSSFNLPKMILLDLSMPKLGGIDVLSKIRADERTRKIPVVMLTSSGEESDINLCYSLGVNSYIIKPVDFDNYCRAISEVGLYWLSLNQPSNNR